MIYNSHEKVTLLWNESLENKPGQLCTIITTEISIQICENCFFHTLLLEHVCILFSYFYLILFTSDLAAGCAHF